MCFAYPWGIVMTNAMYMSHCCHLLVRKAMQGVDILVKNVSSCWEYTVCFITMCGLGAGFVGNWWLSQKMQTKYILEKMCSSYRKLLNTKIKSKHSSTSQNEKKLSSVTLCSWLTTLCTGLCHCSFKRAFFSLHSFKFMALISNVCKTLMWCLLNLLKMREEMCLWIAIQKRNVC